MKLLSNTKYTVIATIALVFVVVLELLEIMYIATLAVGNENVELNLFSLLFLLVFSYILAFLVVWSFCTQVPFLKNYFPLRVIVWKTIASFLSITAIILAVLYGDQDRAVIYQSLSMGVSVVVIACPIMLPFLNERTLASLGGLMSSKNKSKIKDVFNISNDPKVQIAEVCRSLKSTSLLLQESYGKYSYTLWDNLRYTIDILIEEVDQVHTLADEDLRCAWKGMLIDIK